MSTNPNSLAFLRHLATSGDKMAGVLLSEKLKTKYLLAAATVDSNGPVHMMRDEGIAELKDTAPLPSTASQGAVNARLLLLKGYYVDHCAGVGSPTKDGEHFAVDTLTISVLNGLTVPTNLSSAIAFIGSVLGGSGFAKAIQDHGSSTGNHFHLDVTAGGNNFVLTVDPPVTLQDCIADTNDILSSLILHFDQAVED